MPKIAYLRDTFNPVHRAIIDQANAILEEYDEQGFTLTLRQVFYQFVARDLFPKSWAEPDSGTKNTQRNYKKLGDLLNRARLAGLVDWNHMEDRTRHLREVSHWSQPADIIRAAAQSFRHDKWRNQDYRCYVLIEKDALLGVIEPVCRDLDVAWFSCRGYTSASELWRLGMRMKGDILRGQTPIVLHLGDHDPSGIDMSRDLQDRLSLFVGMPIQLDRLALNEDQIDEYNPPPNPAKTTDSRYNGYANKFGDESWELDALDPTTLATLITEAVEQYRDADVWDEAVEQERRARTFLDRASMRWPGIEASLKDGAA